MKTRILLASAVAGSTLFLGGGANAAGVTTSPTTLGAIGTIPTLTIPTLTIPTVTIPTVTLPPVATTVAPVPTTVAPVPTTVAPVPATVAPVPATVAPVTTTVAPVTSTVPSAVPVPPGANITPVANPIVASPAGVGKTLEATSNGWHLTMKALNAPKAGQPTNFMVEFVRDGAGPTGTIYLEQGWYWFTNYQLTSCAANGATCLNFTTARDKTAEGVDHGVIIQAINVPDSAKETKVQLSFTVISGADPRCTFYTAAYREVAVNPILVAPPAVRDFGCKA